MRIRFSDCRPDEPVTDEREAREILLQLYPHAVFGDMEGMEEDERRLVWRDESEADNDMGGNAVAGIYYDPPRDDEAYFVD